MREPEEESIRYSKTPQEFDTVSNASSKTLTDSLNSYMQSIAEKEESVHYSSTQGSDTMSTASQNVSTASQNVSTANQNASTCDDNTIQEEDVTSVGTYSSRYTLATDVSDLASDTSSETYQSTIFLKGECILWRFWLK